MIKTTLNNSILIIQLDRPKVNAINLDMIQSISDSLDVAINNPKIKGTIITGTPGMFSGGLDLIELSDKDKNYMRIFWDNFSSLLIKIYSFPKLIFSAISGHSPAGGTVIAIMTDYRIMNQGKYFIGLNEVAVGLVMPIGIGEVFKNILGYRVSEKMTLKGELIFPEKAKEVGLIDELVDTTESGIIETSISIMKEWFNLPLDRQIESKLIMRERTLDLMRKNFKKDNDLIISTWFSEEGKRIRQSIINKLKK